MSGAAEPTDEECSIEEEEGAEEEHKSDDAPTGGNENTQQPEHETKGIPEFWYEPFSAYLIAINVL